MLYKIILLYIHLCIHTDVYLIYSHTHTHTHTHTQTCKHHKPGRETAIDENIVVSTTIVAIALLIGTVSVSIAAFLLYNWRSNHNADGVQFIELSDF